MTEGVVIFPGRAVYHRPGKGLPLDVGGVLIADPEWFSPED